MAKTSAELLVDGSQMASTLKEATPGIASTLDIITATYAEYGAALAVELLTKNLSTFKVPV